MKHLKTEIEIKAPADKVWDIFIDIKKYPEWNPFIRSVEGEIKEGETFKVTLHQPDSKPMTFKPKCLKLVHGKELRWLGHLFISGLFDGEHIFELQTLENGNTKFIQREEVRGLLSGVFWKMMDTKTRKGFEMMNEKLKELAEKS
jgi:hypothetical protein